jgi:hypothetical protein
VPDFIEIEPEAKASLDVTAFLVTSTMRAFPFSSKWVSFMDLQGAHLGFSNPSIRACLNFVRIAINFTAFTGIILTKEDL